MSTFHNRYVEGVKLTEEQVAKPAFYAVITHPDSLPELVRYDNLDGLLARVQSALEEPQTVVFPFQGTLLGLSDPFKVWDVKVGEVTVELRSGPSKAKKDENPPPLVPPKTA